ncbi:MAG TPA: aspartate/glutamate racemase family protein [Chitinophagaceae bacterium]|nr:aspartate/glutamate racemase family protein [Chitinophagaceae bacterium]
MKTIGIIGGLTWVSTIDYYRLLNEMINEKLGGNETAKILLYSVNFGEIKRLTETNDWPALAAIMREKAKLIEAAGADCLLLGANTMHHIADEVQAVIKIPLIHIAEETAKAIEAKRMKTVALLGTKYTMQLNFFKNKLLRKNITTLIPAEDEINYINQAIYNEMSKSLFLPATKNRFIEIIHRLIHKGAEGIILGCTEIPLLIKQEDAAVPLFDTTLIHATAAVEYALNTGNQIVNSL